MIAGVAIATVVSFLVTAVILKADKTSDEDESFEESVQKSKAMKSEGKELLNSESSKSANSIIANLRKVSFACDAGMGSSAMGATTFKKNCKKRASPISKSKIIESKTYRKIVTWWSFIET